MTPDLGDTQLILKECRKRKLTVPQAAYVMATAFWETARTMKPVREAFWMSDEWRRKNLRYYPWYGRGYVQLTWERNYRFAGERLGRDLTTDADAAMEPQISAEILVVGSMEGWFTGRSIPQYINDKGTDYRNARRVINDTDKAVEIARIADAYAKMDWLVSGMTTPAPAAANILQQIIEAITAFFRRKNT